MQNVKNVNGNVKTIIVSEMTNLCTGTEQEKIESEIVIGKREKVGFKTRAKGRPRLCGQCGRTPCTVCSLQTNSQSQWSDLRSFCDVNPRQIDTDLCVQCVLLVTNHHQAWPVADSTSHHRTMSFCASCVPVQNNHRRLRPRVKMLALTYETMASSWPLP